MILLIPEDEYKLIRPVGSEVPMKKLAARSLVAGKIVNMKNLKDSFVKEQKVRRKPGGV